ncbi:MAG: PAS domain S-box protein, partial [Gammaproteobacteria bacterium]
MQSAPPELARSALDAAPDAMIIIDASGVIRFANRQVSALFGYPRDDIIGMGVEHLMPERFREQHLAHRQSYTHSVRVRPMGVGLDLFGQRADGTEFPVEISLSPIEDGNKVLVAAAIRDVSDRKRAEAELIAARRAADRANQGKSRFLATASHDLRQPLQTLSLLNGNLRRLLVEPEAAQILAQQEIAIGAMSRLLNALLDISKLESGAVKPDPSDFAVNALFEELRLEFASLADNKGLGFKVTPSDVWIYSDRSLVEQILKNLVSKATKYTRQGWIALRCLCESPSSVRIEPPGGSWPGRRPCAAQERGAAGAAGAGPGACAAGRRSRRRARSDTHAAQERGLSGHRRRLHGGGAGARGQEPAPRSAGDRLSSPAWRDGYAGDRGPAPDAAQAPEGLVDDRGYLFRRQCA